MSMRVLLCLALTAALPAVTLPVCAEEFEAGPDLLEPGGFRQLNVTQAHLREMQPRDQQKRRPSGAAMARLVGKMLSERVKGLDLELNSEPAAASSNFQDAPGALRLNRRAELVYDNYRIQLKRKGIFMKYEVSF